MRIGRYLVVGAVCALLTNVGVVELVNRGSGITGASLLMFVPVLLVGYGLHAWFTFRTQTSRPKFARYTLATAANVPLWIAGLWLLYKSLNMPIAIAAPVTTVLVFLLNYLLISWAFRTEPSPREPSSEAQWRG